jgi:hypothetical protein
MDAAQEASERASAIGPRAITGKKVNAPSINTTTTVTPVNNPVSVRSDPGIGSTAGLRRNPSAITSIAIIGR